MNASRSLRPRELGWIPADALRARGNNVLQHVSHARQRSAERHPAAVAAGPHKSLATADIARRTRYTAPAMATAPPLVQLSDIHLTFGGTPLLEGAELAVAPGERVCLVGRNGSGKSTLLKIAAGLIEPDRGERFVQPGASVRYLPQEPDLAGYATTLAYVESGLGPTDDPHQARYLLQQLGLSGDGGPGIAVGRRAAPRRAGPRAGAGARHPAAGRADQPPRPAGHRMAGGPARRAALRPRPHQPRPPLPGEPVADHGVARPRQDAAHRHRLSRLRGLARRAAGRGGGGPAQARPQDRARGALGPLRRHRPAQAQRAPHGQPAGAARDPPHLSRRRRHGGHGGERSGALGQAGGRGQGHRQGLRRPADRRRFLPPPPARRPPRHRRTQRQRQDHAGQPAHRRACPRQRHRPPRRQRGDGDARPGAREPRSQLDAERGADRRPRRHRDDRRRQASTWSPT